MSFEGDIEQRHKEMLDDLESISIEDLQSSGVSLSFGGKTFKFSDLEIIRDETLEDKLKKEYREKLNEQQQRIRKKINAKINQLLLMHQQKQQELDRKELALKSKYQKAAMMPDITEKHMLKGLSVVKGAANDESIWIYRATYNPRFILVVNTSRLHSKKEKKPIPARLVNRMKKDILIIIKTKKEKITSVDTKQNKNSVNGLFSLPSFSHYHQTSSGDCWGTWTYPNSWIRTDDILLVAKDAEAVLEVINQGSIAKKGPTGLPRLQTLLDAVDDVDDILPTTASENADDEDVWQSI